jgi:hypothetical protein
VIYKEQQLTRKLHEQFHGNLILLGFGERREPQKDQSLDHGSEYFAFLRGKDPRLVPFKDQSEVSDTCSCFPYCVALKVLLI